jgi:hypothetical protein
MFKLLFDVSGDQQRFPIFCITDAADGSAPLGFVQ